MKTVNYAMRSTLVALLIALMPACEGNEQDSVSETPRGAVTDGAEPIVPSVGEMTDSGLPEVDTGPEDPPEDVPDGSSEGDSGASPAAVPAPEDDADEVPPGCEATTPYHPMEWDPDAPISERRFDPAEIDPEATDAPALRHFVYLAEDRPRRGELFVFFSGSKQGMNEASNILNITAYAGYHAISLAYSNAESVNRICQRERPRSADCHGAVLEEKIYGRDTSPLLEVSPANSIMTRLTRLVTHLDQEYPDEGWGDYVVDGELDWSLIGVGGGSQGGKVSAFISRDHATARAVLMSAMGSAYNQGGTPQVAEWSLAPRATPNERTYGLWHEEERANLYAPAILASYGIDQLGGIVDVDDRLPPYGCSHQLRTALLPSTGDPSHAHTSLGSDRTQAMEDGQPALTPVYLYMLTAEHD